MKNGFKMCFLLLFLVFSNVSAVMHRNNEKIETAYKDQSQTLLKRSQANAERKVAHNNDTSKSRKRARAIGKVAGIILLGVLGLFAIGTLIYLGIFFYFLFQGL